MCFPSEWYLFQVEEKNKMGKNKREALTSTMAALGGCAQQMEREAPAGRSRPSQLMCHRTHDYVEAQILYKEVFLSYIQYERFENIHVEIHVAMDTGLPFRAIVSLSSDAVVTYRIKEHHTSLC